MEQAEIQLAAKNSSTCGFCGNEPNQYSKFNVPAKCEALLKGDVSFDTNICGKIVLFFCDECYDVARGMVDRGVSPVLEYDADAAEPETSIFVRLDHPKEAAQRTTALNDRMVFEALATIQRSEFVTTAKVTEAKIIALSEAEL
jgi:hypothetical protein